MFGPLQVRDGARQFEHAMESSRRKTQLFGGVADKADPRLIQLDNLFDERGGSGGIARRYRDVQAAGNVRRWRSRAAATRAATSAEPSEGGGRIRSEARIAPTSR